MHQHLKSMIWNSADCTRDRNISSTYSRAPQTRLCLNSEWRQFALALFALVWSASPSAVLPSRPGFTATLRLGYSRTSALLLLQSPRHRRRTHAEETWWRKRRRRSGVQTASTSLHRVSGGRGEKWGRGEWKCEEGEGGERGGGIGLWMEGGEWGRKQIKRIRKKGESAERNTGKTDGKLYEVWQRIKSGHVSEAVFHLHVHPGRETK